ncbi:HIT family protein [Luteipulveratus mongoliensis]|uniref:HIT domain-containing protein n=1 Tax=Luteipulveratus mongoliensis TaxID=571913 RepID=A0A0K1JGZ5_9MICO|nr:hypothetical protein [Luteipulveratus mongoliensis]AKU15992.1 hypothetical protein VV02_09200 [Luteipulveratus mongoliensis]
MTETDPSCWFCSDTVRTDPPPGGWLYADDLWRVGHTPAAYSVAGTTILELRRHAADEQAMTPEERASLGTITARLLAAVTEATGCDRVYRWATMDAYAHFHLWLIPWWQTSATRGPRYLMDSVNGPGATPEEALATAGRLRSALEVQG